MTPSELEQVRVIARHLVTQTALEMLYKTLVRSSPVFAQSFLDAAAAWRQSAGETRFPWASPEYSDLLNAEYQQALEDFLHAIESVAGS
jgi:hypothetical protein